MDAVYVLSLKRYFFFGGGVRPLTWSSIDCLRPISALRALSARPEPIGTWDGLSFVARLGGGAVGFFVAITLPRCRR